MIELFNLSLKTIAFVTAASAATIAVTVPQANTNTPTAIAVISTSIERFQGNLDKDRTTSRFNVFECVHGRRPTRQYPPTCECLEKWSGRFCDRPTCIHGELNEYKKLCSCRYGWTGIHCDTPACGAYGRAKIVAPDSDIYVCQCDNGFNGDRCENRAVSEQSAVDKQGHDKFFPPAYMYIMAICALLLIISGYCCTSHKLDKYCRRRHGDDHDDRLSASPSGSREALPSQVYVHPLLASPFARVRIVSESSSTDLPPSYDDATRSCFEDRPPSYSAEIVALYLEEKDHANV